MTERVSVWASVTGMPDMCCKLVATNKQVQMLPQVTGTRAYQSSDLLHTHLTLAGMRFKCYQENHVSSNLKLVPHDVQTYGVLIHTSANASVTNAWKHLCLLTVDVPRATAHNWAGKTLNSGSALMLQDLTA